MYWVVLSTKNNKKWNRFVHVYNLWRCCHHTITPSQRSFYRPYIPSFLGYTHGLYSYRRLPVCNPHHTNRYGVPTTTSRLESTEWATEAATGWPAQNPPLCLFSHRVPWGLRSYQTSKNSSQNTGLHSPTRCWHIGDQRRHFLGVHSLYQDYRPLASYFSVRSGTPPAHSPPTQEKPS